MVSLITLIVACVLAFFFGGIMGMFIMSLLVMSKSCEADQANAVIYTLDRHNN